MANKLLILLVSLFAAIQACASDFDLDWGAEASVNAGGGDFAPYYIASNSDGLFIQPAGGLLRAWAGKKTELDRRFSYGFMVEAAAGGAKGTRYDRFDADTKSWTKPLRTTPYAMLLQLFAEVKYRGVFLSAGLRGNDRSIFDSPLGVGDITMSRNSRAIPQVRIGFIDFQDIPFTQGWVQIQGEIAYGKFADNGWLKDHYNYYDSFLTTGVWFHYKRCYFRTNPDAPFSVTLGMQHAAQFGGYYRGYSAGEMVSAVDSKVRFRDFVDVFIQKKGKTGATEGDSQYYNGNHLGSWDFRARYRFAGGDELTAYFQWPWEDGSGIGKLNGWDGVWGLEYKAGRRGIIDGASVVYVDFTNQSGPIHWAPGDHPGTGVGGAATGADDYYNNFFYNGWQNYGMALGTPFVKSPVYNRDGYLRFTDNRIRGFQLGLSGSGIRNLDYRILFSWRDSRGTPIIPSPEKHTDTSMLIEARYSFSKIEGLSLKAQFAFDSGSLLGNNAGGKITLSYSGKLTF